MAWPDACGELADGLRDCRNFRRERAVREVVETLGPSDGRHHAARIRRSSPQHLEDLRVKAVDAWGNPFRWPGLLLGTASSFSPTTLRYLSHALWLRENGRVKPGGTIVEIGVGFGGLAAMNAIVSGARTVLVDLPLVARAASRMLEEVGLAGYGLLEDAAELPQEFSVVSNYAFTELTKELQDHYIRRFLRASSHGMIVSNASVFSASIQGRDDAALVSALKASGIDALIDREDGLLGPTDHLVGVSLVSW